MGMIINYWNCKYCDYDKSYCDGEGEVRFYNCSHPNNLGECKKRNKWNNEEEYCEFAETENK